MWSIPLLAKEGWLRHQVKSRSHRKRRRRGGQLGEIFRPEQFRRTDHPGRAVSERIHFYLWRVHPSSARRGILRQRFTVAQLVGSGPRGRHVGSHGCGIAVEIAIEPVHLPLETFDQMGGFAGPSEIVIFSREKDNFAWHAIMLERAEPLLALFD